MLSTFALAQGSALQDVGGSSHSSPGVYVCDFLLRVCVYVLLRALCVFVAPVVSVRLSVRSVLCAEGAMIVFV